MSERKYERGEHILSLDELAKQKFIYMDHKVYHRGWFESWQFRFLAGMVGVHGRLYYAIPKAVMKTVCNLCGRVFESERELKRFVEFQKSADDVYVLDYEAGMDTEGGETFWGCPHCRTDKYLMDKEVEMQKTATTRLRKNSTRDSKNSAMLKITTEKKEKENEN